MDRFFFCLSLLPSLVFVSELIVDPLARDQNIRRLMLWFRGMPTAAKKEVLNLALTVFTSQHYKHEFDAFDVLTMSPDLQAEAEYQPNTVMTTFKQIFAQLHREHIQISKSVLTSFPGSYEAIFDRRSAAAAKCCPNFGRLPHQTVVDENEAFKLCHPADPPSDLDSYQDVLDLFTHRLMTIYKLRGSKEPANLKMADLLLSVKQQGKFIGRECLEMKGVHTDKKRKLRMSKGYDSLRNTKGFMDMVSYLVDFLCVVKKIKILVRHFPEGYDDLVFRKPLPMKEVRHLKKAMKIGGEKDGFVAMAHLSPKGAFEKKYPSTITQHVAKRCDFIEPK